MNFKNIFKAFPTPEILAIPYAGISLSDSAVRCVQFGKKGESELYIKKYKEITLPPGIIVSGQVIKKEELVKVLKDFKDSLKLEYVKISLPEERAYLFTAKIPMIQRNEVQSAIESKIEENVPVPPAELIFDYKLIDHRQKGHIDVVVSALPIAVIDMYIDIATDSGLSLLSLEIESQAITRALLHRHYKGTVLIVHFGQEKVGLYVASDRMVRFTSTLSLKGESVKTPDLLVQEIKKLYTYWHTQKESLDKPEKQITRIIICGEVRADEMQTFLSSNIETRIDVGDVWLNAFDINTTVPEISFNDSLKYAVSAGLALPHEILI